MNKEEEKVIKDVDIAIIGAGIAGLSCANELIANGKKNFIIIEASDGPGGRIRTDKIDGYLLDRGFQVFIEEYPQAKELLNYNKLNLEKFLPGALVRYDNTFYKVSDPFRRPQDIFASIFTPIGDLLDKIKIGIFSILIRFFTIDEIIAKEESDTLNYLSNKQGLSSSMIERFFAPFYQGIFLSPLEYQNSRMFEFVFKMFTEGAACLPAAGMQEICEQIVENFPEDTIEYNTKVKEIKSPGKIIAYSSTGNSEEINCKALVVATDPDMAKILLNGEKDGNIKKDINIPIGRSSTCLYYGFEGEPPIKDPMLILNGENSLSNNNNWESNVSINNICFPSQVSSTYAPIGCSLASVTVVGHASGVSEDALQDSVRNQLKDWFGDEIVNKWKFLRTYRIKYAQPAQTPPYDIQGRTASLEDGVFICGDHRGTATLNGAIESGRRAAKSVIDYL